MAEQNNNRDPPYTRQQTNTVQQEHQPPTTSQDHRHHIQPGGPSKPNSKGNRRFLKKSELKKLRNKQLHSAQLESSKNFVVNLSNKTLSDAHFTLLGKGLSFCPTPKPPKLHTMQNEISYFHRKLRLRDHFYNPEDTDTAQEIPPFRPKSTWTPQKNKNDMLECFITANHYSIENTPHNQHTHNNLTKEETSALTDLKHDPTIIIKPADKGGAIVILNTEDYITEAHRQLNNTNHYHTLRNDPTPNFHKEIQQYIQSIQQHLDKNTYRFLKTQNPNTARFYLLPKIHKEGNPGRPIISANSCATENISAFVDYHLQPLAQTQPSYIKDTTLFINLLRQVKDLPPHTMLVTADVSSLYTSIPHKDGIHACRNLLNTRSNPDPPTAIITKLTHFILTKNNFTFNSKNYLQVQGTAMGTKMAPAYANIFMAHLETNFLKTQPKLPLLYKRYIDDIFILWQHDLASLHQFMEAYNNFHPTIKFTHEISNTEIHFLDVTVYISNNQLHTKLYCKPTDKHQYLHYTSCHPKRNKQSIPYSQALRLIRICSEDHHLDQALADLTTFLTKRGYPKRLINDSTRKARAQDRNSLLNPDINPGLNKDTKVIPCILTYNPYTTSAPKMIHDHWPILLCKQPSPFKQVKPIIAHKRPKNIRDHLVRALLPTQRIDSTDHTSRPCQNPCTVCTHMKTTNTFTSNITHTTYPIRHTIDCKTQNMIYLIECTICPAQYVGETKNTINYRLVRHRSSHKTHKEEPVATHFNTHPHTFNNVTITGIEHIQNGKTSTRKLRESYWINELKTTTPPGLNIKE